MNWKRLRAQSDDNLRKVSNTVRPIWFKFEAFDVFTRLRDFKDQSDIRHLAERAVVEI